MALEKCVKQIGAPFLVFTKLALFGIYLGNYIENKSKWLFSLFICKTDLKCFTSNNYFIFILKPNQTKT